MQQAGDLVIQKTAAFQNGKTESHPLPLKPRHQTGQSAAGSASGGDNIEGLVDVGNDLPTPFDRQSVAPPLGNKMKITELCLQCGQHIGAVFQAIVRSIEIVQHHALISSKL